MIKKGIFFALLILMFIAKMAMAGEFKGSLNDFELKIAGIRCNEYGNCYIIGSIKNVGSYAGGPKLSCIAEDIYGNVMEEKTFLPNYKYNIHPGVEVGIKSPISRGANRSKSARCQVVEVFVW